MRVSDGLGAVVRYEYDGLNRRIRETRLLSEGLTQRVDYHYDPAGRLIEVEQSADQEGCGSQFASTRYEYDRNGNIIRIQLPAGGEILREYDAANRLIAETHREERSGIDNRTQFGYDAAGNLTEITDNQGRKTRIAYDLLNREIRRIERDGGVQRTVYDRNGQVVRLIRPNEYDPETDSGDGFQFTYDAQGRVLTVLSPDGHVLQSNTYDADGRLLQRLDGVGSGVKYEYDLAGAQRRIVSMGGASQELEYDARGRITGIVDGNGSETKYLLDEWGRITGVVKADGSTERYAYNFAGDMVSSTDGEGHTTQYEYNRMGKISAIVDPTGERETYHYDGQGRLIRKTDRNGVTVEMGYNLYGAPLFKKEKDGAQGDFYEYTPEGLLKCAISAGMRYAYEYDEMGRMTRKSASGRTLLALEYDRNGNKVRQVDVTGKLTGFDYDPMGQLLRLTDDGQELAVYTYNPDGTPRAVAHGPIRQEYAYDLDKNLTGLTVRSGEALLSHASYAYDGNGNRIRKQALDGTTLYQYDALNQLQRVDYPAYSEELFYDKAGNRARRLVGGEEELYQYDPRNRLMALTRGGVTTPFQYDNAGNLLQDDKARYSYDAFNRTVKVETFDGNVQVNRYDAEGLRHEMEENGRLVRFIFHKGEAVAEQEENSNVIRLIRGSELIARSSDSESARTYYHYASDEMGSTTHIVDEQGNVQNRYAYDAWGKIEVKEEAVPNRFTYYGQQIDPITQQYYLRARFYNPVIGRFTQEDTYRGDGLNLYAYCHSNPIYYTDPSGFSTPRVVHSNNPEVMDILQSTTQFLQGVSGERVGAIPSRENFNTWFDSLTVDQLKVLMTDNTVNDRITDRLRLGDRHEWLMVSNAAIAKSWGLSAYDIQTLTNYTSELYFLNVKNAAGVEQSGFHTGTPGSSAAHMGPDGINELMRTSSSFDEFKLRLNVWADEHLVLVTDVGISRGRQMLPGGLIVTDAELENYKATGTVGPSSGLNPSPRAAYTPN